MKKSTIMTGLIERLDKLEQWRKAKGDDEDAGKRKGKKSKEDEEVCPNCGGDLQFVEDGIVFCPKCDEYFEQEGEEDD